MSAVFGIYYNKKLKCTYHKGEGNPKVLGYNLFKTLYYAWPEEIMGIFKALNAVNSYDIPPENNFDLLDESLGLNSCGFSSIKKNVSTYQEILSESQSDIFRFFTLIRHSNLRFIVDGTENIKTWGVCDWVYVYNLNQSRVEVYYRKEKSPDEQTIIFNDDLERVKENFDLITTMLHDQKDEGRNQFDLSGMDYAYDKVFNK